MTSNRIIFLSIWHRRRNETLPAVPYGRHFCCLEDASGNGPYDGTIKFARAAETRLASGRRWDAH